MALETREFAATGYSRTLIENGERMDKETARVTIAAYQTRWETFINKQQDKNGIPTKLTSIIGDIKNKAIAKEVTWSTVRLYKATACYGLTMYYLAKYHPNSDTYKNLKGIANFKPEKGLTFDNSLTKDFFQHLYSDIKDFTLPVEDRGDSKSTGRTSSTKAKSFSKAIYDIIVNSPDYTGDNFEMLRRLIELNCIIGLRPIEWFNVRGMTKREFDANTHLWFDRMSREDEQLIVDRTRILGKDEIESGLADIGANDSVILILNGKNSMGRAGINYRVLYSPDKDLYKQVNEVKSDLLKAAERLAETAESGGDSSFIDDTGKANVMAFQKVMKTIQKQMHYIVNKDVLIQSILNKAHGAMLAKKKFELGADSSEYKKLAETATIKMPTIYSTRHQAVANAKKEGLNPLVIAAMFGHSSIVTASRHYGKSMHGRGGSSVRPSVQNINSVLVGITNDQISTLKSNKVYHQKTAEVVKNIDNTMSPSSGFNP